MPFIIPLIPVIVAGVVSAVVSFALTMIAQAIMGKPKVPKQQQQGTGPTFLDTAIRSSQQPGIIILGRARVAGLITYASTTGSSNSGGTTSGNANPIPSAGPFPNSSFAGVLGNIIVQSLEVTGALPSGNGTQAATSGNSELNMVQTHAIHQCFACDGVYVLDQWFDQNSKYYPNTVINWHRGTADQTVDVDLSARDALWDSSHRGQGIAYTYARYIWDEKIFNTGNPSLAAVIRGADEIFDPRTSTTGWTNNSALCIRHYLTQWYGLKCDSSEINDTTFIAAANICDEIVATAQNTWTFTADVPSSSILWNSVNQGGILNNLDAVIPSTTGTLPAGLTAGTVYYFSRSSVGSGLLCTTIANAVDRIGVSITSAGSGTHTLTRAFWTATVGTGNGGKDPHNKLTIVPSGDAPSWNVNPNGTPVTGTQPIHDLSDMDQVQFIDMGFGIPSGVSAGVNYYFIAEGPYTGWVAATLADARAYNVIQLGDNFGVGIKRVGQPRYTCDGAFSLDTNRLDILDQLLSSCFGDLVWQGGQYNLYVAAYQAPVGQINEDNLAGQMQIRARNSKRDLFNAVRAVFYDPNKSWQQVDTPLITNSTYQAWDNGEQIITNIQLPMTGSSTRAQRIAKLHMDRSRQGITVSFPSNWSVMKYSVRDNLQVSISSMGWVNKEFIITSMSTDLMNGVTLLLQEESSAAYSWNSTDEIHGDPAPDTNLPNLTTVQPPTNVTLTTGTSVLAIRLDGTVFSRILVEWTAPDDMFVQNGGTINIQYKKTSDNNYIDNGFVPGDQTFDYILDVQDGVAYDVQIRALNFRGSSSSWVQVLDTVVIGKTAPPSDVPSITVGQNGNTVVLASGAIDDLDLAGYEYRYGPVGSAWSTLIFIETANSRPGNGGAVTTSDVPPGTWDFAVKAIDTTGNYSVNDTRTTQKIIHQDALVHDEDEAPNWTGTMSGFVFHYTGVISPDNQFVSSHYLAWEDFDNFCPDPVASAVYTSQTLDMGSDQDLRVYSNITYGLGLSQSGIPTYTTAIDTWLTGGSDPNSYTSWTIGFLTLRYLKYRLNYTPVNTNLVYFDHFQTFADVSNETTISASASIAAGGSTVTFSSTFHTVPQVIAIPISGSGVFVTVENVTVSSAKFHVWNTSGVDVGGTINYTATGT